MLIKWCYQDLLINQNAFMKQYIFDGVTSLYGLDPLPPMSHFVIFLADPLPFTRVKYFLNGPLYAIM